jgi:U6 snRNA-associated Sm-like protein LSm6
LKTKLIFKEHYSLGGLNKNNMEDVAPDNIDSKQVKEGKKNPSDFLRQVLGKPVVVELNTGVNYRGILACLDGFMNIAMEQTEEYVDGQLKARYGDCFIRGNNVLYISTSKQKR